MQCNVAVGSGASVRGERPLRVPAIERSPLATPPFESPSALSHFTRQITVPAETRTNTTIVSPLFTVITFFDNFQKFAEKQRLLLSKLTRKQPFRIVQAKLSDIKRVLVAHWNT